MAGIGTDLVVQTAFGDSGHTTFFIASEDDYNRHAEDLAAEDEVKIMKRIKCRGATMEACATRSGTLVGPLLTEVVGKRELTPYKGGWCGNEIFPGAFSERIRNKARDMAFRFGNQLIKEGYRGYFDLDFLIDEKDGEVYLGELNPRICGASSITNHSAFAYADAPLFLFHLMEFSGLKYKIDVEELNERWAQKEFIDSWSQMVMKYTEKNVDIVTNAPPTGVYRLADDGTVSYDRFDFDRQSIESEREAFFLRITGPGDYRYEGADLGILITRGRVMENDFELNDRARNWIRGIKKLYAGKPMIDRGGKRPGAGSLQNSICSCSLPEIRICPVVVQLVMDPSKPSSRPSQARTGSGFSTGTGMHIAAGFCVAAFASARPITRASEAMREHIAGIAAGLRKGV